MSLMLTVDGQSTDPFTACVVHQDDPFPGAHSYELRVPKSDFQPHILEWAEFETTNSPQDDKIWRWYIALGTALATSCPTAGHGPVRAYVLNSIVSVECDSTEIVVRGVCSDQVRTR